MIMAEMVTTANFSYIPLCSPALHLAFYVMPNPNIIMPAHTTKATPT